MKILSHRGYWKTIQEKNSLVAFERSFELGFGTETDVRDHRGALVISHDIPRGGEMLFDDFLDLASQYSSKSDPLTIALNVKADGLSAKIAEALANYEQLDCFVFDMSVPDMRAYFSAGVQAFTRMSEVEVTPIWVSSAAGVWLDSFETDWYRSEDIISILGLDKRVCIVSPELHGRPNLSLWTEIKFLSNEARLMLCTDSPEEALSFMENLHNE
jgi:hypothetical protein